MLSKQIIDSDAFLDMPASSQLLYFHLVMQADDEGFVGNPKKVIRMINSAEDDIKILLSKRFVIAFESGVIVIKHWLIHNTIRMDRFNNTSYQEEKKLLFVKENKAYTERQPLGNHSATQVKLSEVNLIKIELPLWLNKQAWEEWLQYRKESKKKMTELTVKKQLRFLSYHIKDHVKIIERSIQNGWQGLFPLDNKSYGNTDASKVLKRRIEDDEAKREREESAGDNEARKKLNDDIKKLALDKTIK